MRSDASGNKRYIVTGTELDISFMGITQVLCILFGANNVYDHCTKLYMRECNDENI